MFLSPVPTLRRKKGHRRALVRSTAALRYEPCTQFINVSQRALHIYFIDGCRRIKIERNNLLCEQASTEVFRSIFAWLVTFNLAIASHLLIDQSPTPAMPPPNKKEQYYTRDLYIRSISSHEIVRSRGRLHRYTINVV